MSQNADKYKYNWNSDSLNPDQSNIRELKFAVSQPKEIKATILTLDNQVYEFLKESLPYFFAFENFGTRQNKGFGCYELTKVDNNKINFNPDVLLPSVFNAVYKKTIHGDWFKTIHKDYKLLKSGRGRKEGYAKSVLFQYFAKMTPKVRWEKRFIKKQINGCTIDSSVYHLKTDNNAKNVAPIDVDFTQNWDDKKIHKYKFIRALLGLAEQYEFAAIPTNLFVKIESDSIDRFKSPITFKVYENKIFLCADEITDDHPIFNHRFKMEYFKKNDRKNKIAIPNPPRVPQIFSLIAFLDYALNSSPNESVQNNISGYIKLINDEGH